MRKTKKQRTKNTVFSSKYNVKFKFGVQTNGTLLDERFADLFEKTGTHISISYDGLYNDSLRQGTSEVERTIDMLKRRKTEFSCISTISSKNVFRLKEVYEFFKDLNIDVKFNPIYPDGAAVKNADFLITKEEWTSNFIDLFEYWFNDKDCNIALISCIDVLKKYLNGHFGCLGGACLYRYLAVDSFGNLCPCGRLIENGFVLANIDNISDIREAFAVDRYAAIAKASIDRTEKCKNCKWFSLCHSGCNASANLGGDLRKPFEFDCYFTRHMFTAIERILSDVQISNVNRYVSKLLNNNKQ